MNKATPLDGKEAKDRLNYLLKKGHNKRIGGIVKKFQKYVATYSDQPYYETYSDETFINDMIYGIGIAIDKKYEFNKGFKLWKKDLKDKGIV